MDDNDTYLTTTDGKLVRDPDGNPIPLDAFDQSPSDSMYEKTRNDPEPIEDFAERMGLGWMLDDEENNTGKKK